jgi:transposase InsO family protein
MNRLPAARYDRRARPGQGLAHTHIKPRTPRLNGEEERSHRIDADVFNDKLREWEAYCNYHR